MSMIMSMRGGREAGRQGGGDDDCEDVVGLVCVGECECFLGEGLNRARGVAMVAGWN